MDISTILILMCIGLFAGILIGFVGIAGGFIGSKIALKTPENLVKLIFGLIMLYAAVKMTMSGWTVFTEKK